MCLECGCGEDTVLICPECGGRVILIDGKTKCVSCGGAPGLEAASEHQEIDHHHRHHGHSHSHGEHTHEEGATAESGELVRKLRVLLPHWIEHNGEHAESFYAWAERARAGGAEHLAEHIEEAAARMEAANRDLAGAVEHLSASESDHAQTEHKHRESGDLEHED